MPLSLFMVGVEAMANWKRLTSPSGDTIYLNLDVMIGMQRNPDIKRPSGVLRRTILNRVDPVTPLRIEFANRVNYVVRVRPR